MELQEVFYVMAIVYMAIMFIIMIATAIAIFAIKKKIDRIHQNIEDKLHTVLSVIHTGQELVQKAKSVIKK